MAIGFGSTYGAGTTDVLSFSNALASNWSFSCRFFRHGAGGGTSGRIFDQNGGSYVLWQNSSTKILIARKTAGTTGQWTVSGSDGADQWISLVVTQSGTSAPTAYINGISQTVTETQAPTSTATTTTFTCYVGNRSGSDRVWDGSLAELCWWNVVLTDGDAAALATVSPLLIRPDAITYALPLIRATHEVISSSDVTVTGTAVQSHPRMVYSRRHRIYVPKAATTVNLHVGTILKEVVL